MKRILVTGGTGKLARAMAKHPVKGVDYIYLSGRGVSDAVTWDMATGEVQADGPFDAVLHLAAANPSGDQDYNGTADLTHAALRLAQRHDITKFIAASSQAIYGPYNGQPFQETTPTMPNTAYGISKKEMENTIANHSSSYGITRPVILRMGNLAGLDQLGQAAHDPKRTAQIQLTQLKSGEYPKRSYIDVEMFMWLVHEILNYPTSPIINVAALTPIGLDELLQSLDFTWISIPASDSVVPQVILNCLRLNAFVEDRFDLSAKSLLKRLKDPQNKYEYTD